MGLAPILLVGPFVAAVGLVAVWFVMRHKSVQTKSMYSSRRAQIERKVRAARQRTLGPTSKHTETADAPQTFLPPGMEAKVAVPTATWGPPAVGPDPVPPPAPPQVWEVGPTVPQPSIPAEASPPVFAPSETPYAPARTDAYAPAPAAPAPADAAWIPAPVEPFAPPAPEPKVAPVETPMAPAGKGASWSIIGDPKAAAGPAVEKKDKKRKKAQTASWQLSSGVLPADEGEEIKTPSLALAVAQYLVLVVGLVIVLFGVLVMVANTHST